MPARSKSALEVVVVADSRETIDTLRAYLIGVGVVAHGYRSLREARKLLASATALVIFPDELGGDDVTTSLSALRVQRPSLPIVLVSGAPQRFRAALEPDGRSLPPIVLPKPAFGWTILDTIRAHASTERRS